MNGYFFFVCLPFIILFFFSPQRYCALVRPESGSRVVFEQRHSQPGRLLELLMQAVLAERVVPRISDLQASLFFGLRVEKVWKQLEYAYATRK